MKFFKPKFWDKNKISLFSILLLPISLVFKVLSYLKRFLTKTNKCSIPIFCVGNIYLGGTGKTPLCIEIFSILKSLEMNPAFVRKDYDSFLDESMLMQQIGPVYQNKKRISAVNSAIKNKIDVAILDDGFQDFSIKKDLSIVCFNEKQWIGNGCTIPAGPLREKLSALKRAHFVIINGEKNMDIEKKILNENNEIKIFYTKYILRDAKKLQDKKVVAFAGIGNPQNFFSLLKNSNINIIKEFEFPDHYNYSKKELDNLVNQAQERNAILATTEKDYLRIEERYREKINYLKILVEIENKDNFIKEIKKFI
jgi:tetraacyldisaccharide 4'-kinase